MNNSLKLGTVRQLRQIKPFDSLPEASLAELSTSSKVLDIGVGEKIIEEGVSCASHSLYVVLSGWIRLIDAEQQQTIRHLSSGEIFGHFSLLRKLPAPYSAVLSSAGVVLEITHEAIQAIFARHPVFAAWFHADLRRFERELGAFDDVAGGRFLFGQRLGELEHSIAPVCKPELSIRDAARLMVEKDSDYVVIAEDKLPIGLVSDGDFTRAVVAPGLSTDMPISSIMRSNPLTIRARASVFNGMMAMEERNWRHLVLLTDSGELHGVISDTDLSRVLLTSPSALRRRIEHASTAADLRELRKSADQMIVTLYRRGVRAEDLLQINTRFNDDLTVRSINIVMNVLDAPPADLRWCWLSLGAEGRGEMGLRTDQDNAIAFSCKNKSAADAWLEKLASKTNELLDGAGIELCDGGIMARNSDMRHDLDGWRDALENWLSSPDDNRLLWVTAVADSRAIFGDSTLSEELRNILLETFANRKNTLRVLAREALIPDLPLKRFPSLRLRGIKTEQGPSLNVKKHGTHLITHAARLLCLSAGWLEQTGTGERLAWLVDEVASLTATASEAIVAYGVLTDLRLSWHVEQASRGEPLSDIMPISNLGETRKRLLISAYQTVEDVRLRIISEYRLTG